MATPGPTFRRSAIPNCDGNIKPIHLFEVFFDSALIQKLVTETNNYHSRRLQSSPIKHRMVWVDVTSNDIKVFIAICLAMGIIKLSCIHDYWRQELWFFAIPSFSKVMFRDQFRKIHRYLHFCNETAAIPRGNEGYDKLFKVRMLLDDLCPKLRKLYKPKRDICIDESMIPFKGRISFRQLIPSKRT
ncbi:piggyBac transposable element-derived protein 4-like [Hydra vulgaris]|uniref:piggyBac transposable element-derived protein 4-like n=1 Tax=Hydra vulgaris TaxID=6087 RepID=UPI001F5E5817|nr:piggyBac transposable element-derived protein 4-like [Hydra vulgaris]